MNHSITGKFVGGLANIAGTAWAGFVSSNGYNPATGQYLNLNQQRNARIDTLINGAATVLTGGSASTVRAEMQAVRRGAAFANTVAAESGGAAFAGKIYSQEKLQKLVPYLERRGVSVYGTEGNPRFTARADGTGMLELPANPTALQVKHELSHYLDFKNLGYEGYRDMGRTAREASVLDRLQSNRVWSQMNQAERDFSIGYVDRLRNMERLKNGQ
jgi:hypothetical protein